MTKRPPTRYFDSTVIIKYVTNDRETADTIHTLIEEARSGAWRIAISPIVMVEVTRERDKPVDLARAAKIEAFFDNDFFYIREVDAELGKAARKLIYHHLHLRPNDALHLAAAIDLSCDVLYSYDTDLLRLDGEHGLRIEKPREYDRANHPLLVPLNA